MVNSITPVLDWYADVGTVNYTVRLQGFEMANDLDYKYMGQGFGPFTGAELRQHAADGKVPRERFTQGLKFYFAPIIGDSR